jgi:signal transduction histidine kinase
LSTRSRLGETSSTSSPHENLVSASRLRVGQPARAHLRLLLVEDSDDDEMLILHQLARGGFEPEVKRVQNRHEFVAALGVDPPDIVISDYAVPGYGGMAALADLKATGRDIPFILVSGTIGESVAVLAMRAGAHDYVLKSDLTRLPAAVERELREALVRAERARMREQLVISERMASAGTLAAGVAHEINNPLGVAMANLEFVVDSLTRMPSNVPDGKSGAPMAAAADWSHVLALEEPLRDMGEALTRIRDIVRDVKVFSRPQDDKTRLVDVHRVIDSSVRMAWNEIRHRARVVKEYGAVPLVNANESRLGQVALNLVVNAAQAMPEGNVGRNLLRVATWTTRDGHAAIEVTDTGCGIPKENLERIFDPFFTTKPVGVGTGLGLAICHKIVSELAGAIEVESQAGKGTTFRVLLPPAIRGVAEAEAPRPATRQRARVLVVDDEQAIGRALERNLGMQHDVVALASGQEALVRVLGGERFDVIVSDLMMPEMTGMDLHAELLRIDPDQARRIIFMTGGTFTASALEFLQRVPNPRIDKPVESANLLALIAEVATRA